MDDRDVVARKPLVVRGLHWGVVIMFAMALATGYTAFDFNLSMHIRMRDALFTIHRMSGMIVGVLMLVWCVVRIRQAMRSTSDAGRFSFTGVFHAFIGAACFVLPCLPWIARSLDGRTGELFALLPLYNLVSPPVTPWAYWLFHQHKILVGYLLVFLALHIAGALYHRFILRDKVLWTMLFRHWGYPNP